VLAQHLRDAFELSVGEKPPGGALVAGQADEGDLTESRQERRGHSAAETLATNLREVRRDPTVAPALSGLHGPNIP